MGRLHKGGSTRSPEGSVNFPPWGFQTEDHTRRDAAELQEKPPASGGDMGLLGVKTG